VYKVYFVVFLTIATGYILLYCAALVSFLLFSPDISTVATCSICTTNFGTVEKSFYSMFQAMLGDNWGDNLKNYSEKIGSFAYIYFICFYTLAVFIVLNIVTGIVIGSIMDNDDDNSEDSHPINKVFNLLRVYVSSSTKEEKQKALTNVKDMFKTHNEKPATDKLDKIIELLNTVILNQERGSTSATNHQKKSIIVNLTGNKDSEPSTDDN